MMRQAWWATVFAVAIAGWPQAVLADALGDCRKSRDLHARLEACSKVIDDAGASRADKATAHRIRGRLRAQAGALDQALKDLSLAISVNSSDARALITRALVRMEKKDLDGAIADFSAAIAVKPRSAFALSGRAHAYLLQGNTARALEDFNMAIAINPKSASAYNNRGLAHRKAGKLDKAISDYTSAIGINPIYALAYANRGYALEALGKKKDAAADFRQALLIDPSLSGARDGLARLGAHGALAAESERLIAAGRKLVEANCAKCHGIGQAKASPNPRAPTFKSLHARHPSMALREPLTRGIFAPHDEMPQFLLSKAQIDSIVAYINSLSRGK